MYSLELDEKENGLVLLLGTSTEIPVFPIPANRFILILNTKEEEGRTDICVLPLATAAAAAAKTTSAMITAAGSNSSRQQQQGMKHELQQQWQQQQQQHQ